MSIPPRSSSGGPRRDREMWMLRDRVLQLEEELVVTKTQLDKITRQHAGLVQLMKMALSGDEAAAHEVAKLVGVLSQGDEKAADESKRMHNNEGSLLSATAQPHVTETNVQLPASGATDYLNSRRMYLSQQQLTEDDQNQRAAMRTRSDSASRQYRSSLNDDARSTTSTTISQAGSRARTTPGRGSNRVNLSRPAARRFSTGNTAAQISNTSSEMDVHSLRYDDAMRYSQFGLFDPDTLLCTESKPPRNGRVKPRSAGLVRGERPLKYEVVRPANISSSSLSQLDARYSRKNMSYPIDIPQLTESAANCGSYGTSTPDFVGNLSQDLEQTLQTKVMVSPEVSDNDDDGGKSQKQQETLSTFRRNQEHQLRHAKGYEMEEKQLKAMEEAFRRKAVRLQQQLGIAPEGMLFTS